MHFNNLLISLPKKHTIHSGCSSTLCTMGNFPCFCRLLTFYKNLLFQKFFQVIRLVYQSVKEFQDRHSETVGPDLGPNCLQWLLTTKVDTLLFIKSN